MSSVKEMSHPSLTRQRCKARASKVDYLNKAVGISVLCS
jgi:hypothetical protein